MSGFKNTTIVSDLSIDTTINGENIARSDADTGGTASAGSGNQYVELQIGDDVFKVLHDGTV